MSSRNYLIVAGGVLVVGVVMFAGLAVLGQRHEQTPAEAEKYRQRTETATVVIEGQPITLQYCAPGVYRTLVPGDHGIRVLVVTGDSSGVLFHEAGKKIVGSRSVARSGDDGEWEPVDIADAP